MTCIPTLQVALATAPTEAPVWTDLTHRLRALSGRRGAEGADAAISAGTEDYLLDNRDRHLDPAYEDGPYFGQLALARRVRRGVALHALGQQTFAGAVRAAGPIAGWALNEPVGVATAHDQVGGTGGHPGTYTGGVTLGHPGLVGTAPDTSVLIDGTTGQVSVPDHAALDFSGTQAFSILVVFNPVVFDGTDRRLLDKSTATAGWGLQLQSGSGLLVYRVNGATVQTAAAPAGLFAVGTTAVGVVTYDGATLRVYVNGALAGSGASATSVPATTTPLGIGRSAVHGGSFGGRIGPVWLWDTALSAQQAADLYAAAQGTHYERFHGFIDEYDLEPDGPRSEAVRLQCSDGLARLAEAPISGSRPQEVSSDRIEALLDAAPWQTGTGARVGDPVGSTMLVGPLGDRALDVGQVEVQAAELQGTALAAIQEVERSEHGRFFHGRAGAMVFHSRHHRLLAGGQGPAAVFGDRPHAGTGGPGGGELPYLAPGPHRLYARAFLHNVASVTRTNGTEQTASDAASIAAHFAAELPPYSVTLLTDDEALVLANYEVARRKDARPVLTELHLDPEAGEAWPALPQAVFGRELYDVVEIRRRPGADPAPDVEPLTFTVEVGAMREAWAAPQDAGGGAAVPARWDLAWSVLEADTGPYLLVGTGAESLVGSRLVAI